jgi:hypothetical protein
MRVYSDTFLLSLSYRFNATRCENQNLKGLELICETVMRNRFIFPRKNQLARFQFIAYGKKTDPNAVSSLSCITFSESSLKAGLT